MTGIPEISSQPTTPCHGPMVLNPEFILTCNFNQTGGPITTFKWYKMSNNKTTENTTYENVFPVKEVERGDTYTCCVNDSLMMQLCSEELTMEGNESSKLALNYILY